MNAQTSLRRERSQDKATPGPAPASPADDHRGDEIVDLRERRAAIRSRKDPAERPPTRRWPSSAAPPRRPTARPGC